MRSFSLPPLDGLESNLDFNCPWIVDPAGEAYAVQSEYTGGSALYTDLPEHFQAWFLTVVSQISDDPEASYHTTVFEGFDEVMTFLDSIDDPTFLSAFSAQLNSLFMTLAQKYTENTFAVRLTDNHGRFIGFEMCIYYPTTATATTLFVLISPPHQNKKLQHVTFAETVAQLRALGIKTLHASTSSDFEHGSEALLAKGFTETYRHQYSGDRGWHADFSYQL